MRKRLVAVVGVGLTLTVVSACGKTLADSDPEGYAACSALITSGQSNDTDTKLNALLDAGKHAQASSTAAIRNSATNLVAGAAVADVPALQKACNAAGVDVPSSVVTAKS